MATQQQDKSTTVSGTYDIETNGTIVTVLDAKTKESLTKRLSADHEGSTLSDTSHDIVVEDYSNGVVTVKVSAKATPKK